MLGGKKNPLSKSGEMFFKMLNVRKQKMKKNLIESNF
jgi:hypothetical protein